jgi:hypothetical protein
MRAREVTAHARHAYATPGLYQCCACMKTVPLYQTDMADAVDPIYAQGLAVGGALSAPTARS